MVTFAAGCLMMTLWLAGPAAAQEESEQKLERKEVPAAVLAAFAKLYPKAEVIGYTKETDEQGRTVYEVESTEGGVHRDVTFLADGSLVSIEESVEFSALPAAVQQAVKKKYPGAKVVLAEKISKGGRVAYELHLEVEKKEVELVLDASGKETKI
jgi:hypothetical protein